MSVKFYSEEAGADPYNQEFDSGSFLFTVQAGDSIRRIAKLFHLPQESIMASNGLAAHDQFVRGEVLVIPSF